MSRRTAVLEQLRNANPVPVSSTVPNDDLSRMRTIVARRRSTMTTPVKDPVHHEEPSPYRRRRLRPAVVLTVAAILLVAVLGTALVIFSGGDDLAPAQPGLDPTMAPATIHQEPPATPAPTPATTATNAATAPPPVIGAKWTDVSVSTDLFGSGAVSDVIAMPDGFLAVGTQGEGCSDDPVLCRTTIWRSPDGLVWDRVFVDSSNRERGTWMVDAARTSRGYLAVGYSYPYSPFTEKPVAFFSADGLVWELIETRGIELYDGNVHALAAAGNTFLMGGQFNSDGAIWRSEDGIAWTKVLGEDASPPGSAIAGIEWVGDRFLALGGADIGDGQVVSIWSSVDGIDWIDVATDPLVFGAARPDPAVRENARAVARVDSGFVVAGRLTNAQTRPSPAGEGALWFSEDGMTWVRLPTDGVFRDAAILGIAGSGDRLVAVGLADGDQGLALAWRSDDGGMTWRRMPVDAAMAGQDSRFWEVAIRGDIAVAGLTVDGHAAIWAIDLGG